MIFVYVLTTNDVKTFVTVQNLEKVSAVILKKLKQVLLKVLTIALILGVLKKEYQKYLDYSGRNCQTEI